MAFVVGHSQRFPPPPLPPSLPLSLPPFKPARIARPHDLQGPVTCRVLCKEEEEETAVVPLSHARSEEVTVVVKRVDTAVAVRAVVGTQGLV